jgi:hypothetical protein
LETRWVSDGKANASKDSEGYVKKILLAVLLIGTMTAFSAAPQAQEQKPPMQMMHMIEMMKACPMNVEGADIALSDTPTASRLRSQPKAETSRSFANRFATISR